MNYFNNCERPDNLSLVLRKKGELKLEQWPIDETLGPNDCLLQAQSCGICGTDLHLWNHGYAADMKVNKPYVLGHEPSALVLAIGEKVNLIKAGDRVAIEPSIPCFKCDFCRRGRYNLCPISSIQARGLPPMDGCLRRYYTHPSDFCFKISNNMTWEEGAMVQPFAVVVHACRRVKLAVGHNVLVCGAGPVGIMSLLCAKAFGAAKVFITDINRSRLELAKKLGADGTYFIDTKAFNDKEFADTIRREMTEAPDTTLECTGVESSISTAIYATKSGGKVCLIGLGPQKVKIPLSSATMREIEIIGTCRIKDDYQLAIHLISSGKVDLKPLVTHKFQIDKAIDAFKLLKSGAEGVVKVIIEY